LLVAAEILTCLGVVVIVDNGLMPYSVTQYISGALLMFISAEVLEGEFSVSFLVRNSVQLQSQPSSTCTNVVNLGRTYKSLFM
jgi:hypothetical protein